MLKAQHKTLVILAGTVWLIGGLILLPLGVTLIMQAIQQPGPILSWLVAHMGAIEDSAAVIIALSLFVGFMKGRFVLAKSAQRVVNRIYSLPAPASIFQIYSLPFYGLIASMILLGMLVRFIGAAPEIRGIVDIAIGAALVNGSMHYYRIAFSPNQKPIS